MNFNTIICSCIPNICYFLHFLPRFYKFNHFTIFFTTLIKIFLYCLLTNSQMLLRSCCWDSWLDLLMYYLFHLYCLFGSLIFHFSLFLCRLNRLDWSDYWFILLYRCFYLCLCLRLSLSLYFFWWLCLYFFYLLATIFNNFLLLFLSLFFLLKFLFIICFILICIFWFLCWFLLIFIIAWLYFLGNIICCCYILTFILNSFNLTFYLRRLNFLSIFCWNFRFLLLILRLFFLCIFTLVICFITSIFLLLYLWFLRILYFTILYSLFFILLSSFLFLFVFFIYCFSSFILSMLFLSSLLCLSNISIFCFFFIPVSCSPNH